MLRTFKIGGIHPAGNKLSAGRPIEKLPLPKIVFIPIAQHIGAPAKPIVKPGDKVKVGQLIAQAGGFVSANIHSSVSGTVKKFAPAPDSGGYPKQCIVIEREGDEWEESILSKAENGDSLDAKTIIERIKQAGIVGMGGATFPTHVKLMPPPGKIADILIINGLECEPYLTADHRLMLEKGEEIIKGIHLLMTALNVKKSCIGIENNKKDAIKHLTELTSGDPEITVVPLKMKYPQGGEKQLINAITGREVPSGALPIETGAVVSNVGTTFAVYEAVLKNKPLFERVVTVTGKKLSKPSNFLVRIGTPIKELIEATGVSSIEGGKVICGGPMMGRAVNSTDIPVTKGTSGILLMIESESKRGQEQTCIRCGRCITVCPMGLEPYLLATVSSKKQWDVAEEHNVMDCIECGSCSFTCPTNRPLLDYIRQGKKNVGGIIRARKMKKQ